MSVEQEFRAAVRSHLAPLAAALVPVLAELVAYDYPPQVACITFEVFADGFSSGFPVRAFFVDEDDTEFFVDEGGEAKYPSPVDPRLLEIPRVYPKALEEDYFAREPGLDVYTVAAEELIPWFAQAWQQAGGRDFPRVALAMIHDDDKVLDLRTGTWISAS